MILSEPEVTSMTSKLSSCCGRVSTQEFKTLADSHEKLRAIIRILKTGDCWCKQLDGKHDSLCNEIKRRIV